MSAQAIESEHRPYEAHGVLRPDGPLIPTPIDPACQLVVAIPARNEADTISSTIAALETQVDLTGNPLDPRTYEAILLANNCVDRTVDVAREASNRHPSLRLHIVDITLPGAIVVGQARRLAMDEAHNRLTSLDRPAGIIATTDSDTLVSPTWVAGIIHEVERGADAVGGRIALSRDDLLAMDRHRRYFHLLDVGYRYLVTELEALLDPSAHDPWPRHFQHFGASVAVTAEAYRRAGGLPTLPCLEDVAFYNALERVDARVRHSPLVRVTTSARESDRTGFGFGVQLDWWEAMSREGHAMLVDSPACVEERIRLNRLLRETWMMRTVDDDSIALLAVRLGVDRTWLRRAILHAPAFGVLRQQAEKQQAASGDWQRRWPRIDVRRAIAGLRVRLAELQASSRTSTR